MVNFSDHSDVAKVVEYYLVKFSNSEFNRLIETDITDRQQAFLFCHFIWRMVDEMGEDASRGVLVLGPDTSVGSLISKIDYDVSEYLEKKGFEDVWERVCKVC